MRGTLPTVSIICGKYHVAAVAMSSTASKSAQVLPDLSKGACMCFVDKQQIIVHTSHLLRVGLGLRQMMLIIARG